MSVPLVSTSISTLNSVPTKSSSSYFNLFKSIVRNIFTLITLSFLFIKNDYILFASNPSICDHLSYRELRIIFELLDEDKKEKVYSIYWELMNRESSKMATKIVEYDSSDAIKYGKENLFRNVKLTARSLHRANLIPRSLYADTSDQLRIIEYAVSFINPSVSKRAQYYSVHKCNSINYPTGWVGYINGLACQSEQLFQDAKIISNRLLEDNDVHCVYLPTFTNSHKDYKGLFLDVIGHFLVTNGMYSRPAALLAQMWVDYLNENPTHHFLQIASTDGSSYINSAIDIVSQICPEYLSRMFFILLAPSCIIGPNEYIHSHQIVNLIKKEDESTTYYASTHLIGNPCVRVIEDISISSGSHYYLSEEYIAAAQPLIKSFKQTGRLF